MDCLADLGWQIQSDTHPTAPHHRSMNAAFSHITILGGGLLGGSLAMALSQRMPHAAVTLWARKPETVQQARTLGISGVSDDLATAVSHADLLVLAVPVGAMPGLLKAALDFGLRKDCVITDVGSVKSTPHRDLAPVLRGQPHVFIGSHPMAGSERNGIDAARVGLFDGAACLLTNDGHAPENSCTALEQFWQSVGCRTTWMTAADHDALVARISHLPHLLASCGARTCLQHPPDGEFGGGGLRDTTRVAAGNPVMWAEIVTENREAILPPLREAITDLTQLLRYLESADLTATQVWLDQAKLLRDQMPCQPT